MISLVLALATCFVTWKVAYQLARPNAPLEHSKFVGGFAGMCGLPFAAGSITCAYYAAGQGFAFAMGVAVIIAMLIASPVGEQVGIRDKTAA